MERNVFSLQPSVQAEGPLRRPQSLAASQLARWSEVVGWNLNGQAN